MRQTTRRVIFSGPEKHCKTCGRKLDSRAINNPYGMWSIPTMIGFGGPTLCGYCHSIQDGFDPQTRLPKGCEALKQLDLWLATDGSNVH